MITKEMLKDYAKKLMFDMDDNEYETLEDEFKTILKQMELIENIPNIKRQNHYFIHMSHTKRSLDVMRLMKWRCFPLMKY